MLSVLRFFKMSEIFWAKQYCKMSDLFLLVFVSFKTFYRKIWNLVDKLQMWDI